MYEFNNKLYDNLEGFEFFNVDGVKFAWSPKWKNVGINLSGGADSACLAYTIAKYIKENNINCKIHAINFLRCYLTRPWQKHVGLRVYNRLKEMFPDIVIARYQTFVPPEIEHSQIGNSIPLANGSKQSGDNVITGSYNRFCASEYNLDCIFNATTANPPNAGQFRVPERDLIIENCKLADMLHWTEKHKFYQYRPLMYIRKDWVYRQYKINNIMNYYNATMSCEGDLNCHEPMMAQTTFEDYNEHIDITPCGECWWCWERKWAEDQYTEKLK